VYYDYIERADGQYNGTSNACIVAASSPCYNKSLILLYLSSILLSSIPPCICL
jgi:hypothetical protein